MGFYKLPLTETLSLVEFNSSLLLLCTVGQSE